MPNDPILPVPPLGPARPTWMDHQPGLVAISALESVWQVGNTTDGTMVSVSFHHPAGRFCTLLDPDVAAEFGRALIAQAAASIVVPR